MTAEPEQPPPDLLGRHGDVLGCPHTGPDLLDVLDTQDAEDSTTTAQRCRV